MGDYCLADYCVYYLAGDYCLLAARFRSRLSLSRVEMVARNSSINCLLSE